MQFSFGGWGLTFGYAPICKDVNEFLREANLSVILIRSSFYYFPLYAIETSEKNTLMGLLCVATGSQFVVVAFKGFKRRHSMAWHVSQGKTPLNICCMTLICGMQIVPSSKQNLIQKWLHDTQVLRKNVHMCISPKFCLTLEIKSKYFRIGECVGI